ncbi:Possibl zinc metallo-peptidase [Corynebacterium faecale]|nr:Possibl zinc metallo-peptidase [Corynebacterium faecale]
MILIDVSDERFEEMVDDAFDQVPQKFLDNMRNVVVLVDDFHPESPNILGLYTGVALTNRMFAHGGLPDTITIYKGALQRHCHSEEHLAEQVRVTVLHEVGHYFGLEEHDLHRLGYA